MQVTQSERNKISAIIAAAAAADWLSFKKLTDEPFISDEAAETSFLTAAEALRRWNGSYEIEMLVNQDSNGSRMLDVTINPITVSDRPILLLLWNRPKAGCDHFCIVYFYQDIEIN